MSRILNNGCKWVLDGFEFGSDAELDVYIRKKLEDGTYSVEDGKLKILQSVDLLARAEKILNDIKSEIVGASEWVAPTSSSLASDPNAIFSENSEEAEGYYKITKSIGVNRFLQTFNKPDSDQRFVQPFNKDAWRQRTIEALTDVNDPDHISIEEAIDIVTKIEKTWPELSQLGTEIHNIFETIFNGEVPVWNDKMNLSKAIFDSTVTQISQLKQFILSQYPGAKCYTEFGIMTKDLSPEVKDAFGDKYDSINGKIDLIVLDQNGYAHIYDFKVSRKDVGDWNNHETAVRKANDLWDLGKLEAASYQLAFYASMLKQRGITVRDANVVPVKLNLTYENSKYKLGVKNITGVVVNPTKDHLPDILSGKYGNAANQTITQAFRTSGQDIIDMLKTFNEFFPKNTTLQRIENLRANTEHFRNNPNYVVELKVGDAGYPKYKYRFIQRGLPGTPVTLIENDEKLDDALNSFVAKLGSAKADFCTDLGHVLQDIFLGTTEISRLSEMVSDDKKDWVERRFDRYIKEDGWTFDSNEDLISNGIFIFSNGGKSEVVVIERNDLNTVIDLGLGKTLLGKTTKDKYVDKTKILISSNANLALMQAMIYISKHQDDFKNKMISEVSVVNLERGEEQTQLPSKLIYNYNTLCDKNPSSDAIKIMPNVFFDDVDACLQNAESRMRTIDVDLLGLVNANRTEGNDKKYLELVIKALKTEYKELYKIYDDNNIAFETPVWQAYHYLNTALLSCTGNFTSNESDSGMWFNKGMKLNGYMLSSPQYSSSTDIRQLGELLQSYENNVARAVYEAGWKMEQQFIKLYKEDGNGTQVFDGWFRRNPDGSLDERLLLKDPDSAEFQGSTTSREALRMFLRTIAELKRPNLTDADIEQMKTTNEYYEVPLTEAVWSRQIRGNIRDAGLFKGFIKTIRDKWKEVTTLTKNVFAEDEVEAISYKAKNGGQLYNKFDLKGRARQDKIKEHGVGFFETNLEIVFNQALVAFKRIEIAKDYVPRIQAMKLALKYAKDHGGVENKKMQEVFNKIIKSKFYGESIIEDETMQAVYKWLSFVRSIFTTMTLSINVPSFLRESLQGIYTGVSRSGVKMLPGIDMKNYTNALTYVIQQAHKNFSSVSLLQQLNVQYQMANQSVNQIANQRRVNWANIKNWNKDTLFLTATAPDFMHRVSILVAKMMGDDCWDAHSLVDGKLVYDYKKDKRFEQYINENTLHKDYLAQKSLYEKMIEEFNKAGFKNKDGQPIKIGDDLPQAYTPTESQSIKNYADLLYGHYDESSRALINDTFLGSFVLQYKTYITAKFEQWTMPEGVYSTSTLKQQFDPVTGEELYQTIVYDSENKQHREIVRKSQVSQEAIDKGDARIYYDYEGIPMEGMFQEFLHFGKAFATLDFKKFKELWDNPTDRGFFLLALHDQFLMAFLMFLATFVFGSALDVDEPLNPIKVAKEVRKMGPAAQIAFNVIEGSTVDAQFIGLGGGNQGILQGMASNPPMITALSRFIETNTKLITGKQSFMYTLSQNVGAIRSWQGILKELDPRQEQ